MSKYEFEAEEDFGFDDDEEMQESPTLLTSKKRQSSVRFVDATQHEAPPPAAPSARPGSATSAVSDGEFHLDIGDDDGDFFAFDAADRNKAGGVKPKTGLGELDVGDLEAKPVPPPSTVLQVSTPPVTRDVKNEASFGDALDESQEVDINKGSDDFADDGDKPPALGFGTVFTEEGDGSGDMKKKKKTRSDDELFIEAGVEGESNVAVVQKFWKFYQVERYYKPFPTNKLTDLVTRFPSIVLGIFLILPFIFLVMAVFRPAQFDTSPFQFFNSRHPLFRAEAAVDAAAAEWTSERMHGIYDGQARTFPKYRYILQFTPTGVNGTIWDGSGASSNSNTSSSSSSDSNSNSSAGVGEEVVVMNMIQEDALKYVQEVELMIANAYEYPVLCWTNDRKYSVQQYVAPQCVPMASITSYFFPGGIGATSDGYQDIQLSGKGTEYQRPEEQMMRTIRQSQVWPWFFDAQMSVDETVFQSSVLRTQITLGWPMIRDGVEVDIEEYNLIVDTFLQKLVANISALDNPAIEVTLTGDRLIEAHAAEFVLSQIQLTAIAVVIVFLVLMIYLRSVIMPAAACSSIVLTFLASYYVYTWEEDSTELSLMAALSLLVTLGLNVNGMLMTWETWAESGNFGVTGRLGTMCMNQRVGYMYWRAVLPNVLSRMLGICTFAFLTLTPVPALRGFAVIMMISFAIDTYMFTLVFPPALIFYQVHFSSRRNNVQRETRLLNPPVAGGKKRQRHAAMQGLLQAEEAVKIMYGETTYRESQEQVDQSGTYEEVLDNLHRGQERSMSMSNLARSKQNDQSSPKKITYTQGRMARLVSVFQIAKDLTDNFKARPTIDGALASYARRLEGAKKKTEKEATDDELLPRPWVDEDGLVGGTAPDSVLTQYRDKWEFIGRFLGTMRSDEFSAGISEFTTDTVMCKNLLSRGKAAGKGYKPVDPAPPFPKTKAFFETKMRPCMFETWRPAVTRDEKDGDYLNKFTNHLGIAYWPWFFRKRFVAFIFPLRYIATIAFIVLFFVSATTAATIEANNESVNVLRVLPEPMVRYADYASNFPVESWCDYCSAYQQKRTTFPVLRLLDIQQCARQGYGLQIHALIDNCGICLGNNSCIDCESRPNGNAVLDLCQDCRQPTDIYANGCQDCTTGVLVGAYDCWSCNVNFGKKYYSGAGCTAMCDDTLCPPSRGTCNPYTAVCECHQSFTAGYFDNDPAATTGPYCSVCVSGFFPTLEESPTSACQYECDPATASAECNCQNNRCTGCVGSYMGGTCAVENITSCYRGTIDSTTRQCSCNTPTLDPDFCRYHVDCNYHGEMYPASENAVTASGSCSCSGQWQGPKCQFCRCFNGGTCSINGTCMCPPGWGGTDCNVCAPSCQTHGKCPTAWSEAFYTTTDTCVAIWCTRAEIEAGTVCDNCNKTFGNLNCNQTDQASCEGHHSSCLWTFYPNDGPGAPPATPVPPPTPYPWQLKSVLLNSETRTASPSSSKRSLTKSSTWQPLGFCVQQKVPTILNLECTNCKGSWSDPSCNTCDSRNAVGAYCDADGYVIGCDGERTAISEPVRVVDRCGVCNGDGECFGCDGVRGSDAVVDKCGICKGNNACLDSGDGGGSEVTLSWGIVPPEVYNRNGTAGQFYLDKDFDLNDVDFQVYLYSLCSQVIFARQDLINTNRSRCIWADFAHWINSSSTHTMLDVNHTLLFPGDVFEFPFNSSNPYSIGRLLYIFARDENRFAEVAFDNPFLTTTTVIHYPINDTFGAELSGPVSTTVDANLTAVWIKLFLYTHDAQTTTTEEKLAHYSEFKDLVTTINENPLNKGYAMISSPTWTALITERSYSSVALWGFSMLVAVFLFFMCVLTCSPVLVLLAVVSVAQCACCTIMSFRLFGYALGPVQTASICLTGVYAADHMIHQVYDYANRLPNHSSDIVSGSWYLRSAIQSTLARAGPCILVSGISASLTSLTVVFSKFQVFHQMGLAILSGNFWSLLVNLVLFPTLMCFVGPKRSYHQFWQVRLITAGVLFVLFIIAFVTMDAMGFLPDFSQGYIEIL